MTYAAAAAGPLISSNWRLLKDKAGERESTDGIAARVCYSVEQDDGGAVRFRSASK